MLASYRVNSRLGQVSGEFPDEYQLYIVCIVGHTNSLCVHI